MTAGHASGDPTPWVKARASSSGDDCVELRRHGGAVEVRDSKDPRGPVLRFSAAQFAAWLDGAAHGESGDWVSSSTAPAAGGRVELRRRADGGVDVRSSEDPGTVLHYTRGEFLAWLDGVSRHEFDHLAADA